MTAWSRWTPVLVLPHFFLAMIVCALSIGNTTDAWAGPEATALTGSSPFVPGPVADPAPFVPSPEQGQPDAPRDPEGALADAPKSDEQLSTSPSVTGPSPERGQPGAPAAELIDTLHGGISYGFLATASWLDSFFGDERYEAEIDKSQFKIRFDAFREGNTGMDYRRPNFDLRLVLPQLRKKTRLVISGDPNVDVDSTTVQPAGSGSQLAPGTERNLTTAIQYFPVASQRSNFSIRAGVKLHNGKLAVLAGPRYRYLIPLDPWALRFTQEFIWSSDMRWQSRTRFDFERSLPYELFFRTSLEGLWSENVDGYPYALSFLLRHPLDANRALEYEWINSFQTHPTNELLEELVIFRYRQRFWRDWLFLEIAPQYRFPRDRSFEATPGILFRIEMVFGDIPALF